MGWFGSRKDGGRRHDGRRDSDSPLPSADYHREEDDLDQDVVKPVSAPSVSNYVAPSPDHGITDVVSPENDDDGVLLSRDETVDCYDEVNGNPSSFTRGSDADGDAENAMYSEHSKNSHINSLFNGHLMKWKFEAEEGTGFLRVPAFFGALGLLITAIVAVVLYPAAWEPHSIVMTVGVVIMAVFILLLEGRFLGQDPIGYRAHLRNIVTRNFNMLRFVWGRGLLYVVAGVLNISQTWLITIASGTFMVLLGICALIVGAYASRKFSILRNALQDESFLLLVFSAYDSDGDGYLEAHQFAKLLTYLGLELDDRYTLKAFNVIDTQGKRRVSFDDFQSWWSSGFVARGRRHDEDADIV